MLPEATVIAASSLQPSKQYSSILVTDAGMVIDVSDLQFKKHAESKLVTASGILIDLRT